MMDGFLIGAIATEFNPPLTEYAQKFKDAWIAKFGKWEAGELNGAATLNCLIAGLKAADSLDTDAIAAVISNGLEYDTAVGHGQMINRPDLGNERTVDSAKTSYIKTIENGEAVLVDTIEVDEGLGYFRHAFPAP